MVKWFRVLAATAQCAFAAKPFLITKRHPGYLSWVPLVLERRLAERISCNQTSSQIEMYSHDVVSYAWVTVIYYCRSHIAHIPSKRPYARHAPSVARRHHSEVEEEVSMENYPRL